MKQGKKHPPKHSEEKHSHPTREQHEKSSHKGIDKRQLATEIEFGIFEVDKIFEGQGDKLSDAYVVDSLTSLARLIKESTYELYAEKLKEGSDDESDMMHINVVNRLSSVIEELELQVSDVEIIDMVKHVLGQVKKCKSSKSPRAYLDPLANRLKEMGFKSEFLTETDVDGQMIRLDDIDNLDNLNLDEDDDLDIDDLRPGR
ncbi:MAG TPA: hypothetical protein VIS48_10165 [Candidatus Kryptonia bacterium]